jgi:hypothetical protein
MLQPESIPTSTHDITVTAVLPAPADPPQPGGFIQMTLTSPTDPDIVIGMTPDALRQLVHDLLAAQHEVRVYDIGHEPLGPPRFGKLVGLDPRPRVGSVGENHYVELWRKTKAGKEIAELIMTPETTDSFMLDLSAAAIAADAKEALHATLGDGDLSVDDLKDVLKGRYLRDHRAAKDED